MSEEKKINADEEVVEKEAKADKKAKAAPKKENFFVRAWKKLVKFCKDTRGELKKVAWTPKAEVVKSFKLVIGTVVAVAAVILLIDFGSSSIINLIANSIG